MPPPAPGVETLLAAAVERPDPAARAAYLDAACDDPAVRAEVARLADLHFRAGRFLEPPAADPDAPAAYSPPAPPPGGRVGPYKLLEVIGEGGMGVVWRAEQAEPVRRTVALKLVRPGLDSAQLLARFAAERQALALMDHPNIARVLDAGAAEDGRPYFVMELVKGQPLTAFCDARRLPPRDRLELFVQVCRAVQHAHQKGVIHRDLKPGNVLVALYDGRPVPKVIDFGIAKAVGQPLTERTLFTGFGAVVGTPEYMSPEQAEPNQLDVDTRSDVYSLGVLLYELLTGSTPLTRARTRQAALLEVLRLVREEEPPTPSRRLSTADGLAGIAAARGVEPRRLAGLVRGELDWIAMRALEKDRARRYDTAAGLARDVERYLADEPVEAGRPSAGYRLKKFARRHRTQLAVAGLAVGLLAAAGWWAADWGGRRAATRRVVAEALAEADDWQRGGHPREALAAARRAEGLAAGGSAGPAVTAQVRRRRADLDLVTRLDEVRMTRASVSTDGNFDYGLADRGYAEEFRAAGLEMDGRPADERAAAVVGTSVAVELATALDDWAMCQRRSRAGDDGTWRHLNAVARLADPDPWRCRLRDAVARGDRAALTPLAADPAMPAQSAMSQVALGVALTGAGDTAAAIRVLSEAWRQHPADFWVSYALGDAHRRAHPRLPNEVLRFWTTAAALRPDSPAARNNLGIALAESGRIDTATAEYREAVRLAPDHAQARVNLGNNLVDRGRAEEALAELREAVKLAPGLSRAHTILSRALAKTGRADEAISVCLEGIRLSSDSLEAYYTLGSVLSDQKGDYLAALTCFGEALRLDPKHDQVRNKKDIAQAKWVQAGAKKAEPVRPPGLRLLLATLSLIAAAESHGQVGDWERAATAYEKAVAETVAELGEDHPNTLGARAMLAEALYRASLWDAAAGYAKRVVEAQTARQGRDHPDTVAALKRLADCYRRAGRWAESEAAARQLVELATARHGPDHPDTLNAHRYLANTYLAAGKVADAVGEFEGMLAKQRATLPPDSLALLETMRDLAQSHLRAGRPEVAEPLLREVYDRRRKLTAAVEIDASYLGLALLTTDRAAEAEPVLREAVRLYEINTAQAWQKGWVRHLLGAALAGQGKTAEAEPLLVGGYEGMRKVEAKMPVPMRRHVAAAGERVARFYEATNRPDQAKAVRATLTAAAPPGY